MQENTKTMINEIIQGDWMNNDIPDKSIQLIIADPPYFETKGEFDFVWDSFDDYLKDVERWAVECKRVLADNGTLLWYGDAKNIAYAQVIFDKLFNLVNNLVWDKGSFMGLEESDGLRSFAPCTERILMYGSMAQDLTGLQTIEKEYIAPRNPFALELRKARLKKGVTINEVAGYGRFYGNINHGGSVTNWERGYNVPLAKQWKILCENLPIKQTDYNKLRKEYEELRKEYEEKRRYFKNIYNLQEVLKFSNEAVKTGANYEHETVKPEYLTAVLIQTCSRENDLILVPFAGSGTECVCAHRYKRNFIAYEILEKHYLEATKRLKEEQMQLTMDI